MPRVCKAFIILLLCTASFGYAQTGTTPTKEDKAYQDMVNNFIQGKKIDFTALRLLFTKTSYYNPLFDVRDSFTPLIRNNEWDKALALVRGSIYTSCFVLIDFSSEAMKVYEHFDGSSASSNVQFFKYVGDSLLNSIYRSGDGLSAATAWQVINLREEYLLLNSLGYQVTAQKELEEDGHFYDVLEAQHSDQKEKKLFYFNTDLMRAGN